MQNQLFTPAPGVRVPDFRLFEFGSDGKASAYNAGDLGSIPGSGRSPGEGNGNPLQYSCLENPMDKEAWQATVDGVAKSWTRLSDFTFSFKVEHWGEGRGGGGEYGKITTTWLTSYSGYLSSSPAQKLLLK